MGKKKVEMMAAYREKFVESVVSKRQNTDEADCIDCGRPLIRAGVGLCAIKVTSPTWDNSVQMFHCKRCLKRVKVKK